MARPVRRSGGERSGNPHVEEGGSRGVRVAPLGLALALALGFTGCLAGGSLAGEPVPAFSFVTSDGVFVNETTYLGRFVILDLMATWCAPCKLEVAHLRAIQAEYGDRVVILSIGTDPTETIADLEAFGAEYGATWPYAIDRDGTIQRTMQMRIIPKLVVIDPEGIVVLERQGEVGPAAISRVIEPGLAPSSFAWPGVLAALGAGALVAFNPYRRLHKDAPGAGPTLAALGALAALAILAWPFAALASTRATYGGLFVGALSLAAVAWWPRARRKVGVAQEGAAWQRASDRAYELAPGFVAALVLGLGTIGTLAFFAPLFAFLVGAAAGLSARPRVPASAHDAIGLVGLALVGIGLVAYGARIFSA